MNGTEWNNVKKLIKTIADNTHKLKPEFILWKHTSQENNRVQFVVDWLNNDFFDVLCKNGWKLRWVKSWSSKHVLITIERSEITDVETSHFDLCNELHKNIDNIPEAVKNKIWDLVYAHYNPHTEIIKK